MRRDFSLVRKILILVEALPYGEIMETPTIDGYDESTIIGHINLLLEAQLIDGTVRDLINGRRVMIRALTWQGHDFLRNALDDTAFQKAIRIINERGGALSFEVLKSVISRHFSK